MSNDIDRLELYRKMLLIRLFEEKVEDLFARNMIGGTCHLCIGQEACAVGAVSALKDNDLVVSTHRGHGHLLAKGGDPRRLMAELMGKSSGYCAGKGGTQHLCAMDIGFVGTNGITGGGLPIATGAALSAKLRKTGQIVLSFFGDGASNQGTFHESLNMASIWKLPVIYFCENNLYSMSMSAGRSMKVANVADRAAAYGMESHVVDGMDVLAVRDAVAGVIESVRAGSGPVLIEGKTYRFVGHSKSDRRVYRTAEEEEEWATRDPIATFGASLDDSDLARVRREVEESVDDAVEFGRGAEDALADDPMSGVYA